MTQSNQSQNQDNYRELISESDLGKDSFDNFFDMSQDKKEQPQIIKESLHENVEKVEEGQKEVIDNTPSIKESIMIEDSTEEGVVQNSEVNIVEKKEIGMVEGIINNPLGKKEEEIVENSEVNIVEKKEIEIIKEIDSNPLEKKIDIQEEIVENKPNMNEEINNYIKGVIQIDEEKPTTEEKKEEIVEEVKESSIEIKKEEIIQNKEKPKEEVRSYKEIRDEIWNKANPTNINRFKDLNIEETDENRNFLNDISVKITLLDDDIEDGLITENEAIKQIKEIKAKLNFDKY